MAEYRRTTMGFPCINLLNSQAPGGRCYCDPHVTREGTEAQRGNWYSSGTKPGHWVPECVALPDQHGTFSELPAEYWESESQHRQLHAKGSEIYNSEWHSHTPGPNAESMPVFHNWFSEQPVPWCVIVSSCKKITHILKSLKLALCR